MLPVLVDVADLKFIVEAEYRKGGVPRGTPPGESIEGPFLETKLRCELKRPRSAGAEDTGRARGGSVDYILNYVWRCTLFREGDSRGVSKISNVEDVE